MKFEKIKDGMILYDVHKHKMGMTNIRSVGVWTVKILRVDANSRSAVVSWNGNGPQRYNERALSKLKANKPYLIRGYFGQYRLETKDERNIRLASNAEVMRAGEAGSASTPCSTDLPCISEHI